MIAQGAQEIGNQSGNKYEKALGVFDATGRYGFVCRAIHVHRVGNGSDDTGASERRSSHLGRVV